MPLPPLPERATTAQVREIMKGAGWHKKLEFDWVVMARGRPLLRRYLFNADALPCARQDDNQFQLTFVRLAAGGVIKTCAVCGITEGPITTDLGRLLSERQISINEAWEVVERTGQKPPVGLEKPSQQRRVRIIDQ